MEVIPGPATGLDNVQLPRKKKKKMKNRVYSFCNTLDKMLFYIHIYSCVIVSMSASWGMDSPLTEAHGKSRKEQNEDFSR